MARRSASGIKDEMARRRSELWRGRQGSTSTWQRDLGQHRESPIRKELGTETFLPVDNRPNGRPLFGVRIADESLTYVHSLQELCIVNRQAEA
jgi:hypothetical protein